MIENKIITSQTELLPAQIERMDNRLKQIEKIAETVESITEKGLEAATKYLENKAETDRCAAETKNAQHQREIELQDKQHKRSTIVLSLIVSIVFVLIIVSMYMQQFELVKIILNSSLAVAGGAGLSSIFRRSNN